MAKKKFSGELLQVVGERGEKIFELAISDYSLTRTRLFRHAFFTDRWPAIDYVVELVGVRNITPFFFVQVKSTTEPIVDDSVKVDLPPEKKMALARLPGPTYV